MILLFDDQWIDKKAGVERLLRQPEKLLTPILAPEKPWERDGISGHMACFFDKEDNRFKMWYRSRIELSRSAVNGEHLESSEQAQRGERVFLCYAESSDGLQWYRPMLRLHEFEGSKDNNIICEIDFSDTVYFNIVKDPGDPDPKRRYKALGFAHDVSRTNIQGIRLPATGVCVAFSPDGFTWPDPPLLVMHTYDLTDADCILPHRETISGKWIAFFRPRTYPKRRFVGYATSEDFERWSYPHMMLTPDQEDDEWTEFYGLAAQEVDGVYLGALWVMHNNPAHSPMTNELVVSHDGKSFMRIAPRQQWLPLGSLGAIDSRRVWPLALIPHDDMLLIYYDAGNRDHGSDRGMPMQSGLKPDGVVEHSAIGLARIPLGHYVGLYAAVDGMVESKWLCNYGTGGVEALVEFHLYGTIQAEVLDQYGAVIPGYERSRSQVTKISLGRYGFQWDIDPAAGVREYIVDAQERTYHVVKLRFYLYNATLFGFQVGTADAMPPYV